MQFLVEIARASPVVCTRKHLQVASGVFDACTDPSILIYLGAAYEHEYKQQLVCIHPGRFNHLMRLMTRIVDTRDDQKHHFVVTQIILRFPTVVEFKFIGNFTVRTSYS